METVVERARIMPVPPTDISSMIRWNSTAINDNRKDNKSRTSDDLDDRQHEFHFTITPHTKNLNNRQRNEEHRDPNADIHRCRAGPVLQRDARGRDFEGQDGEPLDCVVPAAGKAPGGIDKTHSVGEEGTVNGKHDSQLRERLHDEEHHYADDAEAQEERGGPASMEGSAGADEEACADCAA